MGQRLVISIYADKSTADPLATIYYHWSAYTAPAAYEMEELIGKIQEWEDRNGEHIIDLPEKEAKLALVRIGESLHAVSDEDAEKMQSAIASSNASADPKALANYMLADRRKGSGVSNEEAKRLEALYPCETFKRSFQNGKAENRFSHFAEDQRRNQSQSTPQSAGRRCPEVCHGNT